MFGTRAGASNLSTKCAKILMKNFEWAAIAQICWDDSCRFRHGFGLFLYKSWRENQNVQLCKKYMCAVG